ncbi:plant UBX domain-containing protein 8-like [Coffea arabica]|uniref:Plant UBX domain-containing protein 8-like n=1 Tax=Coffea arabica TaxID=13443 RepID=A0A6P6U215_COFAR|nr:plant UBX domain-containing protein 8-like [Coffea arabica]XP_027084633.1 plant UBX domain-containing protein 8-like [Coffea arabica]
MARPNQEAIEMFMSITGVSESIAIQRLEEHGGDLNQAVNAHFAEGDRNITHETPVAAMEDDVMDIDDAAQVEPQRPPFSLLSSNRNLNPFSLLDPNFRRSILDSGTDFTNRDPFVSHPREVREVPIEVKDGNGQSGRSDSAPIIEDVTETAQAHGPEIRGNVILDEDDDKNVPTGPVERATGHNVGSDNTFGGFSHAPGSRPTAPGIDDMPDYSNDIEEEMIRAAIEASKRDAKMSDHQSQVQDVSRDSMPQHQQSHLEDPELARAMSLSLKTAEREKALRELEGEVGVSEVAGHTPSADVEDHAKSSSPSNGRLHVGISSVPHEEGEDIEEAPLVRHRARHASIGSADTGRDDEEVDVSPRLSPRNHDSLNAPRVDGNDFPSDEWGGISSEEHDEAVMLEAAMFGGIPEGSGYRLPYAPHHMMQNGLNRSMDPYTQRVPRPPSPSLTAQRLLREQQDDEYLASLQADREKELKAKEEAEAAIAEERRKEEEFRKKQEEEQEVDRQLAAKEASLPQEPPSNDENAVTLLVRMPDGSRRGRRFLKSDRLQCLFDFIDISRVVKPGNYRLVRPYPRQAFSDGESGLTLNELGLTSKQEALFLELI